MLGQNDPEINRTATSRRGKKLANRRGYVERFVSWIARIVRGPRISLISFHFEASHSMTQGFSEILSDVVATERGHCSSQLIDHSLTGLFF